MRVLANWIAKLVQFLYCSIIYHADCSSGPFCTFKWTFLCIQVDLFVQSSGPFSDWGVLQSPENPPWLWPCMCLVHSNSILVALELKLVLLCLQYIIIAGVYNIFLLKFLFYDVQCVRSDPEACDQTSSDMIPYSWKENVQYQLAI